MTTMATKATKVITAMESSRQGGERGGTPLNPFTGPIPDEVPLPKAPLIYTVVQIRFPTVLEVERRDLVAPFQNALRDQYPILRQEFMQTLTFSSAESHPSPSHQSLWRFTDNEDTWRVALTSEFVAIETRAYASREDLLARLRDLLSPVLEHIRPAHVDRIGVRYVDRVTADGLDRLSELIAPPLLGVVSPSLAKHIKAAVSQNHFECDEGTLVVRAGLAPRGTDLNTGWLPQFREDSWMLDMDMFSNDRVPSDSTTIIDVTARLTRRIYAFFRWATTDEFLRHYGASK